MRKRHRTQYPGIMYRLVNEDRPDGPRRYIVFYTDANGAEHSETLPVEASLEEARARKAELDGKKRTYIPTNQTVGELLDDYLEARRSSLKPKTIELYEYGIAVVKDHMGRKKLKALTTNDIARLISKLKADGKKTWTVKKILTPLVGALKVAVREGWIQSNPADHLLPHERPKNDQKEMRCVSSSEIPKLLKAASTDRWRTLFALLIFTGLRIGEALALRWEDIDIWNEQITVRESKTKAGERTVMLMSSLKQPLAKLSIAQPPGTEYVFANKDGKPVSRREALRALRAAEKKAGLTQYTLHELRHTFASILIAQGETPVLVAHQMGHADPSVTLKTYAHLFDEAENVEAARAKLSVRFEGVV